MRQRLPLRSLAVAALLGSSLFAHALTEAATGRRQSSAEIEDIGEIVQGDSDAKSTPAPAPAEKHFRFNVGGRGQYTSNAQLSGNHSSSDFIFFPNIEAGYHVKLDQHFSFDSALRVESGVYANYTQRSFIGYSLQNTLDYRPAANLPRLFIGVEPYRYDSFEHSHLITEAVATSVGSDYGYAFNNGHSLAFIGYTFADHFAHPLQDDRRTNTVIVGLSHSFATQLTGQVFYQYEYSNFYNTDRDDSRNVVGINLTYQINRHLFATLSGNFVDNNSSDDRASYQSAGASLGLNLQY